MAAMFVSVGVSSTASAADAPTYTGHSAIIINGENNLLSTVTSEGWSGDGTSSNPYVISDYDITASTYCISITNTVSYIIIRNCSLHGASSYGGIVLNSAQHVTIYNNTCYSNYYGIQLVGGSNNNTIIANNVNSNNIMGIRLDDSDDNMIANNVCTSGSYDSGIRLTGSDRNTIRDNTLTGHFHSILLSYSNLNIIYNNNCVAGSYNCILLGTSSQNSVSYNICRNSNNIGDYSGNGIQLESGSEHNYIGYNTCYSNLKGGIFVWGSDHNDIANNTCYSNAYGVYLLSSSGCSATYNTCYSNQNGVYVQSSSSSTVTSNNCYSNSNRGIGAYSSSGLVISGNTVPNDYYGIMLVSVNGAIVTDNICTGCSDSGIRLEMSDENLIDNNICSNSISHGICLAYIGSNNNVVTNNTCSGNTNGIHLYSSGGNIIANNDLVGNKARGIYAIANSDDNSYVNNTCTATNLDGTAMYIEYSTGNTITDNHCYDTIYGIYLWHVTNSMISENVCNDTGYGITVSVSSENDLVDNYCHDSSVCIYVYSSSLISVVNNTCIGNSTDGYGIYFNSVTHSTISGNICNGDVRCRFSIYLYYSSENTISNNTCINGDDGVWLYHSATNDLFGNEFRNNSIGVSIDTANDNVVTNNTFINNTVGVQTYESGTTTLSGNSISDSSTAGVNLLNSYFTSVSNSTFINSTAGVRSANCHDIEVYGNTLDENVNGIFIIDCYAMSVFDNSIAHCYGPTSIEGLGIYLSQSSDSTVWNNTCNENNIDIYLNSTTGITVTGNTCSGSWVGINFNSYDGPVSQDVLVSNNSCTDCFCGIAMFAVINSTVSGNTCSNFYYGIYIEGSSGIEVIDNMVVFGNLGIYFNQANDSTISSNLIGLCEDGVIIEQSHGNVIDENSIAMCTDGIHFTDCNETVISGNSIDGSSANGIYLSYSMNNSINANSIYGSDGYGIYLNASTGNLLFGNELMSNHGAGVIYNSSAVQGFDDGDNDWNSTYGNLWSDRTYPDDDLDGFVDVNYTLDGGAGNSDQRPIANASLSITVPAMMDIVGGSDLTVSGIVVNGVPTTIALFNEANGASGNCTGTTSWSGTVAMVEGYNNITVTMIDAMGRILTDNVTVLVDTTAPVLTVTSPANGSYHNTGIVPITWTVSDALVNVSSVMICVDGGDWTNVTNVTSYTNATLSEGAHTIYFNATDSLGNYAITSFTIIIDLTKPIVVITAPLTGSAQNLNSTLVSWTVSDDNAVANCSISTDGTNWIEVNGTSFQLHDLAVGNNTIYVRAYDIAGNYNQTSVVLVVDITDPTVAITSPSNGSYDTDGDVTISWTGSDDQSGVDHYWVNVDGIITDLPANATSYTFEGLSDGTHIISVRAFDRAGNNEWMVITVIVDTTAPTVMITYPSNGSYLNDGSVQLSWAANDVTSGVVLTQISTDGTNWTTVSGSVHPLSFSSDGTYTVYVRVTDDVGFTGTAQVTFTVDTTAPSLEVTPVDGDHVNDADTVISMSGTDASGISHYSVSMDGTTWTVLDGDSYQFEGLDDGAHMVYVRAYDLAGNYNTSTVRFTVDTVAPKVTSYTPVGDSVSLADILATVSFSETMDMNAFTVAINGEHVGWAWGELNSLSFAPADIRYGAGYMVLLSGADLAGNIVTFSWSFTTIEAGSINGTLVNEYGHPMTNVTIVLNNGMSVTTDDEGHFFFEEVPVGLYVLSVESEGYELLSTDITVTADEELEMDEVEMNKTLNGGGDIFVIVAAAIIVILFVVAGARIVQQRRMR